MVKNHKRRSIFYLKKAFPDMTGFSARNLKYMRKFAEAWPEREFVQQLAAPIPWFYNCLILDRLHENSIRKWYISKTVENGWSRNILAMQIKTCLHERDGKSANNFDTALPPADSDMAAQIFKDTYVFDFLGTADPRREAELEQGLIDHIQKFLFELGQGFAFVGRQVHFEVGERDFFCRSAFLSFETSLLCGD